MLFMRSMSVLHTRVDPGLLVALDALLTERNVTRAAHRLGLTQSAVSHKLRALREQLGDPLLVSGKGGLIATERAEAIAPALRKALLDLTVATSMGSEFDPRGSTRAFRISTADYGELTAIPRVIAVIEHEAPDVDLAIEPPYPDLAERLSDGRLDAAVGPAIPMPAGILRSRLVNEGFEVVVRAGHPVARRRWTLARYLELRHLVIAPRGRPGSTVDDVLASRGQVRRVAMRVASFVAAPFVVAATDLCLTAPSGLISTLAPQLGLVVRATPLEIPGVDTFLYWHARTDKDPAHRWLRQVINRAVRAGKAS